MSTTQEYESILRYTRRLKIKSYDLRSKLTALVLYTEESENLSQEEKNHILDICNVIGHKNDELIDAERQLEEIVDEMFPDARQKSTFHSLLETL